MLDLQGLFSTVTLWDERKAGRVTTETSNRRRQNLFFASLLVYFVTNQSSSLFKVLLRLTVTKRVCLPVEIVLVGRPYLRPACIYSLVLVRI